MGAKSLLTERQWAWVCDRYREGYRLRDLGGFLGMTPEAVGDQMRKRKVRPQPICQRTQAHRALTPLGRRNAEFMRIEAEHEKR